MNKQSLLTLSLKAAVIDLPTTSIQLNLIAPAASLPPLGPAASLPSGPCCLSCLLLPPCLCLSASVASLLSSPQGRAPGASYVFVNGRANKNPMIKPLNIQLSLKPQCLHN